jgi:hypothetical protein
MALVEPDMRSLVANFAEYEGPAAVRIVTMQSR